MAFIYVPRYAVKHKKKKPNFSKLLCVIGITLFVLTITVAILFAVWGLPTEVFMYIIPAVGIIASASVIFYLNKAKTENLSKQRIRYVLMKLLLKDDLSADKYIEICDEIDNIDGIIDGKINSSLAESVNEDIKAE